MNALALSDASTMTLDSNPFDLTALMASPNTIEFKHDDGSVQKFTPDETIAYFAFENSFGFPEGITQWNLSMHPNTIANSYKSLISKPLDYEHRKNVHNPKLQHDHFLGFIAAASFPNPPSFDRAWKITDQPSPRIRGVAGVWKSAMGLKRILGEHITGRHAWSVSFDVGWGEGGIANSSSFAVKLPEGGKPELNYSTPDYLAAGYEYIPGDKAPQDLIDTFNTKASPMRVDKEWKGRKVTLLMNERIGHVHYAGLGLVRYGAEKSAKILQVVASGSNPMAEAVEEMRVLVGQFLVSKIVKSPVVPE